jgi:hypothetical protein
MEKHILSKSTFIKGHQCLKSLYLHKKRPFLRDKLSAEQLAKFKRGHKVGEMAQQLFPGGIDVSPKSPSQYQKSVIQTQELIAEGETIIYEATFQFNKVLVMLDILVKTEKGWEAYEVKSSRALSETYFTDAALQYYVITQSGLDLASFSLIYVNENYVQESEIDVQSYFIKQNVIAEIQKMQNQIENEIENELQILTEAHSPKIEVGAHCFDPYQCDFLGFCWKKKSSDIFKLPALSKVERTEMIDQGVLSITELKSHKWNNPLVNLQLESLFNEKPYVSSDLKDLLSTLPSDIVYLGFIARQAAIPQCAGHKSYQNQLLAYSFISSENSKNILFSGECNDYQAFIKHLIGHLSKAPQIVVYDKEYLAEILKQVAEFYPKLSSNIEQINNKILGIKQWIKDGQFYYPGIKHELLFKDVIKQVLNTNAYAKQSVYADVLAVNMYEQMLEKSSLFDEMDEGANAILAYVESLANYTKQIAFALR